MNKKLITVCRFVDDRYRASQVTRRNRRPETYGEPSATRALHLQNSRWSHLIRAAH